ncbi:MAG: sulfatase-like hydrolase/transferase [Candidatus Scalindua sp.]|nr:sulfatase-like hydrolase/transferase [Candidatus Scalindua sp.]
MWKFLKSEKSNNSHPNIIMILLDQYRNDARVCHGIFEKLKERGVLFSETITYAPYTLASLHAAFTGMYGVNNGVDGYTKSNHYDKKGCLTLAEYLQGAGYYTRGYTFSPILFPSEGFDNLQIVPEEKESDVLLSHQKELEICFNQERSFFCYLHYGDIHHEIVREVIRKYDDFDTRYFGHIEENRKRYLQYASSAAVYTDKIINTIDKLDTKKNTLLIVTTDHGGGIGEKPGEKAYGIYTYDYSICVWLYLIYPSILPVNKEFDIQVRTIDILPTIMDLLNIKPSRRHKNIQGKSLLPIIREEETLERVAFSETGGVEGPHPSPDKANVKCIRQNGWKLIYNLSTSKMELYDLSADPEEINNLAQSNRSKMEELWSKLAEYL